MARKAQLLVAGLAAAMLAGVSCSTASGPTVGTASPAALATSHTYDVRDLVFERMKNVPARTDSENDDLVAFLEMGHLISNIEEVTDPNYWENGDGHIDAHAPGYLVVKANQPMHARVHLVLNDFRRLLAAQQTARASDHVSAMTRSLAAFNSPEEIRAYLAAGLEEKELNHVGFDQVTIADRIDSITSAVLGSRARPTDRFARERLYDSLAHYVATREEVSVRRVAGAASCLPIMRN